MSEEANKTPVEGTVAVNMLETAELGEKTADEKDVNKDLNLNMILDIPVHLHVELGNTELSIREILKMGPGSIVELDRAAGGPADLIVNGKLIGKGDIVVVGDNFGIRLTSLVNPEQRIESL